MDVRNLRQIVAIRRHGSFAKAAHALGMSQPSLSQSIARLEDELGLKLFDRTSRGSALTPVGELILDRAERVIAETRDLARDATLLAGGDAGAVRIGCATSLQHALLQPLILRIVDQHPRLRLHAELGGTDRLLPLLESRELDVVFCASTTTDGSATPFVAQSFLAAPAVFVASPSHPLARERRISVERLAEFRCAGSRTPGHTNATLLGADHDNLGMYTASSYDSLLPLALAEEAVLLARSFIVKEYLASRQLVRLDVQWRLEVQYQFVTTRAASFSPILQKIGGYAGEIGDQLRDAWRELRID